MSICQKLRWYYDRNKISARKFDCRHYNDCKSGHKSFVKAREAYVGQFYETTCPRLLFLSLDSGTAKKRADDRTMSAVRKGTEKYVPKANKNPHWYWTLEFAVELLKPFREDINFRNVVYCFAHTNSAKCCMNKEGRAQADSRLFKNCREFIAGELDILAPDVIVTQGDKAREGLAMAYEEIQKGIPGVRKTKEVKLISIAEQTVLWIHTYHPAQKQSYFKKRNWVKKERYSRLIESFLKCRG